jgi:20S proteasome subunit alpha 7
MSSIGTGYDLSAGQFSPDGRVFQVEYAQKAVENSGSVIAIRGSDGVVFGVEKIITSKLYEDGCNRRVYSIDDHIGAAVSGMLSDARAVVNRSRDEAANYRNTYQIPIPLKTLTERVGKYMHYFTVYSSLRPFGVSILLGTWNERDGPKLHEIDPSGVVRGYFGCAVGKGEQNAKTEIEKLDMVNMPCKQLIKEVAKIIYSVHDEVKDKHFELELSWIGKDSEGRHELVPDALYDEAKKFAEDSLNDSDDEDTDM